MAWKKFEALPGYFGGKRRLVNDIFKHADKKEGVFIDAFLGGGSVSLWAKAKGYRVITNDIAERSCVVGRAIIQNSKIKIADEDLARLFVPTKNSRFIEKNYTPKVFVRQTARFLDNAFAAIRKSTEPESTKRYLLLLLLIKFIGGVRQFGKFTHTKDTIDLENENYDWPLRSKSHAQKSIRMIQHPLISLKHLQAVINRGIFDNHQENEIHQLDIFDFLKKVKGDIVYFDPPYPESSAYEDEYYVLDCILAEKKIKKEVSVFSKADAKLFLEKMFECSLHIPQWIVSLGQTNPSTGIKPQELLKMVRKFRKAEVEILKHNWVISNAAGRPQGDNIEYIVHTI